MLIYSLFIRHNLFLVIQHPVDKKRVGNRNLISNFDTTQYNDDAKRKFKSQKDDI